MLYIPRWEENSILQGFFSLKLMFKLLSLRVIIQTIYILINSSFPYFFNTKLTHTPQKKTTKQTKRNNTKGRNP